MSVTPSESEVYRFEGFILDAERRMLFGPDGTSVRLMPKAIDTLLALVQNKGRVLSRDEILALVWPDTIVEENNLTQNISALRKAFNERPGQHRFIVTVPGQGYKFVAAVSEGSEVPAGLKTDQLHQLEKGSEDQDDDHVERPAERAATKESGTWKVPLAIISLLILLAAASVVVWRRTYQEPDSQIRSLAILPFKSLVPEMKDEALELGMADALISKLSGAGEIAVRPLSSVRRFGAYDQDSIAAGRELSVQAVMDGNIQISGDRLRVTAALIRVSDQKQLWAGKFDEKLTDIFSVQDSISNKVASALRIPLTSLRRDPHTDNIEAYQLYMKGVFHTQRLVLPEVQKGITYFEQAIALDPAYAKAYLGLEQAYRAMVLTNDARPNEIMPKAKAATKKALELDPTLAEAWSALAISDFWYDWDWRTAESHHLKALELDRRSAMSHFYYAHMLSNTGRHDEALGEIRQAREIAPVLPVINALEGQILTFAGQYDDALTVLRETSEANPDFWLAHLFLARLYLINEMNPDALASATKARELTRGNSEATATIGRALVKLGKRDEAMKVMAELEDRARTVFVPSYTLAQLHLALGNRTKALELLSRGVEEQDALMVFLKVDPAWDELRSDTGFVEIIKQLNF